MTPGDPPSPEKTTDIGGKLFDAFYLFLSPFLEGTIADESAAFVEGSSRPPSCAVIKNTALLVYAIFMLHGVGTLMPWNVRIRTGRVHEICLLLDVLDNLSKLLHQLQVCSLERDWIDDPGLFEILL